MPISCPLRALTMLIAACSGSWENVVDRNSKGILMCCAVTALLAGALMATWPMPGDVVPTLECSVDDTLSFVAYDVTSWDMNNGTLVVRSKETTHEFTLSRDTLDGETCKEIYD